MNFLISTFSPLALYTFGIDENECRHEINSTSSGTACINGCIIQMMNEVLPFGGFGQSGMGSYHGEYGFRAFSHEKALLTVHTNK